MIVFGQRGRSDVATISLLIALEKLKFQWRPSLDCLESQDKLDKGNNKQEKENEIKHQDLLASNARQCRF